MIVLRRIIEVVICHFFEVMGFFETFSFCGAILVQLAHHKPPMDFNLRQIAMTSTFEPGGQ